MKRYRITKIGKIFFIGLFLSLLISLFLKPMIFKILLGFTFIAYIAQIISVKIESKANKEKLLKRTEKIITKNNYENVSSFDEDNGENFLEARIMNTEKSFSSENSKENKKDLKEDLKEKTENLDNITLPKEDINNYFEEKKEVLDESFFDEKELEDDGYEEESIFKDILSSIKRLFKLKKYHNGDLIIHDQFGIGKVIESDDVLTISFMNDNYREEIQFEYDSKNKIPEISLFKVPRGEDKRNYYYDYREDISEELKEIINKIELNFEEVCTLKNIYLKIDDVESFYDLIVINNKVNIFSLKDDVNTQPIEALLENYELNIDIDSYSVNNYDDIDSILLKNEGNTDSEIQDIVRELIELTNIIDFNERKYNLL